MSTNLSDLDLSARDASRRAVATDAATPDIQPDTDESIMAVLSEIDPANRGHTTSSRDTGNMVRRRDRGVGGNTGVPSGPSSNDADDAGAYGDDGVVAMHGRRTRLTEYLPPDALEAITVSAIVLALRSVPVARIVADRIPSVTSIPWYESLILAVVAAACFVIAKRLIALLTDD